MAATAVPIMIGAGLSETMVASTTAYSASIAVFNVMVLAYFSGKFEIPLVFNIIMNLR